MIGIDRKTGRTITDFEQLVSRVIQVMTTPLGGRVKRPKFGSRVRETLAANMSDSMLLRTQSFAVEACYNPENGVQDFIPSHCVAKRCPTGVSLYFAGKWQGLTINFEVPIDVSPSKTIT